jgi:uncharacterized metal-binding protein
MHLKRLVVFGALGPAIGFLVVCVLDHRIAGDIIRSAEITLPLTYAFDLGPLLLCAFLDFHMEPARWWERLAVVAFVGFVTVILLHLAMVGPKLTDLRVGLVGAIPAVLCCWLSIVAIQSGRQDHISVP